MDENIKNDENKKQTTQHKKPEPEQATSNVSSTIESADATNNANSNSKRTQVCDAEDDETAVSSDQAVKRARFLAKAADVEAKAIGAMDGPLANAARMQATFKEAMSERNKIVQQQQRNVQPQDQGQAQPSDFTSSFSQPTHIRGQGSQHSPTTATPASNLTVPGWKGQAGAWLSSGGKKSSVTAVKQPTPTNATAPVVAHSEHTVINYNYYGSKVPSDEGDEEELATLRDILSVKAPAKDNNPSPCLAHNCFEDAYDILFEVAKIKDVAAQRGVSFSQAAPREDWIEGSVDIVRGILKIFEGAEGSSGAGQRYGLVVETAKKALQALEGLLVGDEQQKANGQGGDVSNKGGDGGGAG